jgi:hypothetical protein
MDHEIDIREDGTATHTLRYRVHNPLSSWAANRDATLVKELMADGRYGMYLRVFTPVEAWDVTVEINGEPASIEDSGIDTGRMWNGVFIVIPKDTSAEVVVRWQVPTFRRDQQPGYDLYLQRQPGLIGLCSKLSVRREGVAAEVSVDGVPADTSEPLCHAKDAHITIE